MRNSMTAPAVALTRTPSAGCRDTSLGSFSEGPELIGPFPARQSTAVTGQKGHLDVGVVWKGRIRC